MPFRNWLARTSLTGSTPEAQRALVEPLVAPAPSMTSRVGVSMSLASYCAGPLVFTAMEAPSHARSMVRSVSWMGESAVWLEPIPVTARDSATTRPAIRALLIRSVPPLIPLLVLRQTQRQAGGALRAPGRDGERDRVRCDPSNAPVAQGVPRLEDVSDAVRRLDESGQTAWAADDTG